MELLYWQLVYFFVKRHYRIIKMSNVPHEIWLESRQRNAVPLVRLVRYDVDWGSWLRRDVEYTEHVAEQLQKRYGRRFFQVLNVYVSTYPPVDDWEWIIDERDRSSRLKTILIHSANVEHSLNEISRVVNDRVSLVEAERFDDSWAAAQHIQRHIFRLEKERQEQEKRLFEYGQPLFTYMFIVLQVLMFLVLEWQGGSRNPDVLIQYGAKFNPLIEAGEWWRFLTPIFLHIGFLHLLMNTMALYYLGTTAERLYGSWRFLAIYLFGGFFGTLASFLFTDSLSAGASGAIFGLFGALLYFGTVYRHLFFQTMGTNIIGLVVLNIALGLLIPNIDNAGHIGGLIGGFLAASAVHLPRHRALSRQLAAFLVAFAAVAAGLYIGL